MVRGGTDPSPGELVLAAPFGLRIVRAVAHLRGSFSTVETHGLGAVATSFADTTEEYQVTDVSMYAAEAAVERVVEMRSCFTHH